MNKLKIVAALSVGLAIQSMAYAGPVKKLTVQVTTTAASGGLDAARHSSDNTEHIGCTIFPAIGTGTALMECGATDKSGNALYCYLFSPSASLATALAGINETSYIQFYSSTSTSQCTYLEVDNESWNLQ